MGKVKSISEEDLVMSNEMFMSRKGDGYQIRELGSNICGILSCLSKPS